jgi:predicted RNA-binding protein YlqC (UPF0109 family)
MKELLLFLVTNLVKNPESVAVKETTSPTGETTLELSVSPDDMGFIVRAKAILENKRVNLTLIE